jgi:hypothetical protein
MNRFQLSLSGLLDAVRGVVSGEPPKSEPQPGTGRTEASRAAAATPEARPPDTVRLRYQPLVGTWDSTLVQRLQNTVESAEGTRTSGYELSTGGVWTVEPVHGELHGRGGMVAAEPEVRWIGVPTPGDRQRVALLKAMPSPDMTVQTTRRGAFLGVSVRGFPDAVLASIRSACPPGAEQQVEAYVRSVLDVEHMQGIAYQNWFATTGFFLGEPVLEVGRTYTLDGEQQAVDGGPLPFSLKFGLERIEGSKEVAVWLEDRLDVEALGRVARFQVARLPAGTPVPVPVSQVERNELRVDPETLHVSSRVRERVSVSDVAGVGRVTRIDRMERSTYSR